ncbi:hypothetical protein [Neisseria meningitidis]|nr:hypothetical protein [Neisseria meningitidis]
MLIHYTKTQIKPFGGGSKKRYFAAEVPFIGISGFILRGVRRRFRPASLR